MLATSEEARRSARSSIARNVFYLALGQGATTVLAVILTSVLGRSLGAADFGIYFLVVTMSTSAYVLVEWGQPLLVVRETARTPARSGQLLGTALALRVAFAIAAAIPAGLVTLALGYGARTTWLFVLLFLASLPFSLAQGYGMVFRAYEEMGWEAAVSVSNKAFILCIVLPGLALGAGIPGVILAQAVAGGAALAIAQKLYSRLNAPPLWVCRQTGRDLIAGGLPLLSMSVMGAAQPYLEAVILSKLAPATALGWFGAARTILSTLAAPAYIVGAAAYPRISRAASDATGLPREVQAALRPLVMLGALAATGTFVFAEAAVGLVYGTGFAPASTILKVAAPGLFLLFLNVLIGHVLYATGVAVRFAIVLALKVVVSAGLSFVLIPTFQARTGSGGIGVVLSSVLGELFVLGGAIVLLRPGTLTASAVVDAARALAAAGLTVLVFRLIPLVNPWLGMAVCIFVFGGASWCLGLMRWNDMQALLGLFRRTRTSAMVDSGD
jgi:O-antigen/teichoic acid export membrane protein